MKTKGSKVIERAKARADAGRKSNYTFRLNIEVLKKFKSVTTRSGVSMSEVIEIFMEECSYPNVDRLVIKKV